jgi:hypothetical protein
LVRLQYYKAVTIIVFKKCTRKGALFGNQENEGRKRKSSIRPRPLPGRLLQK